jgi:hypothetical protein
MTVNRSAALCRACRAGWEYPPSALFIVHRVLQCMHACLHSCMSVVWSREDHERRAAAAAEVDEREDVRCLKGFSKPAAGQRDVPRARACMSGSCATQSANFESHFAGREFHIFLQLFFIN